MMLKKKINPVSYKNVRISDSFWNKYTKLVTQEILPYQWRVLNDQEENTSPSHCIENFKIAAKEKEGEFYGFVFQDTDAAKWLEAVAYSLAYEPNPDLEQTADELIELIQKAQQEDGYLDTYFIIKEPNHKFSNLREGHELYTFGHFMEAAVAYYEVTGKDQLLNIMKKTGDLICDIFHKEEYQYGVPGHQEVEIGLIRLYQVTNEEKYLAMAKDFIDRRGETPNYLIDEHKKENWIQIFPPGEFQPEYSQCHKPVREQSTAEGHSVRAVYMYTAMAELAYAYQDESLLAACENLYQNIVNKRMYITGAIGSSGILERFTTDYDLPNESNYGETCASIGLAMFCNRMLQVTGEERYAQTMETALMNTVTSGIAMDGKSFFYVNPLEVWPDQCLDFTSMSHVKPVRQKWFGCACCPPNIARTLASLSQYIYHQSKNVLWINLYAAGEVKAQLDGEQIKCKVKTKFPFQGEIKITIDSKVKEQSKAKIKLRVPSYGKKVKLVINGVKQDSPKVGDYVVIDQLKKGMEIILSFQMKGEFVYPNPLIRADAGKVAIKKGPLVYALEEIDNGKNLAGFFVREEDEILEAFDRDLLGGTTVLYIKGKQLVTEKDKQDQLYINKPSRLKEVTMKLVPYCYWGNRTPGEMLVWMKRLNQ